MKKTINNKSLFSKGLLKRIFKISFLIITFFLFMSFSQAECIIPEGFDTSINKYKSSPVVFVGQVISANTVDGEMLIEFNILKNFKGTNGERITITINNSTNECGYDSIEEFSLGDIFAIYSKNDLTTKTYYGNKEFLTSFDATKDLSIISVASGQSVVEESGVIISDSCKRWSDGCNECSRDIIGGSSACTERTCSVNGNAFCREVFAVVVSDVDNVSEDDKNNPDNEKEKESNQDADNEKEKESEKEKEVDKNTKTKSQIAKEKAIESARLKKIELERKNKKALEDAKKRAAAIARKNKNRYESGDIKTGSATTKRDISKDFSFEEEDNKGVSSDVVDNQYQKKWVKNDNNISNILLALLVMSAIGSLFYYFLHKERVINHKVKKRAADIFNVKKKVEPILKINNIKNKSIRNKKPLIAFKKPKIKLFLPKPKKKNIAINKINKIKVNSFVKNKTKDNVSNNTLFNKDKTVKNRIFNKKVEEVRKNNKKVNYGLLNIFKSNKKEEGIVDKKPARKIIAKNVDSKNLIKFKNNVTPKAKNKVSLEEINDNIVKISSNKNITKKKKKLSKKALRRKRRKLKKRK